MTFLGCSAMKIPRGGSWVRLQSILQMIFLNAPRKSLEKAAYMNGLMAELQ